MLNVALVWMPALDTFVLPTLPPPPIPRDYASVIDGGREMSAAGQRPGDITQLHFSVFPQGTGARALRHKGHGWLNTRLCC